MNRITLQEWSRLEQKAKFFNLQEEVFVKEGLKRIHWTPKLVAIWEGELPTIS